MPTQQRYRSTEQRKRKSSPIKPIFDHIPSEEERQFLRLDRRWADTILVSAIRIASSHYYHPQLCVCAMPRCCDDNKTLSVASNNKKYNTENLLLTQSHSCKRQSQLDLEEERPVVEQSHRRVRCDLSPVTTSNTITPLDIKLINIKVNPSMEINWVTSLIRGSHWFARPINRSLWKCGRNFHIRIIQRSRSLSLKRIVFRRSWLVAFTWMIVIKLRRPAERADRSISWSRAPAEDRKSSSLRREQL